MRSLANTRIQSDPMYKLSWDECNPKEMTRGAKLWEGVRNRMERVLDREKGGKQERRFRAASKREGCGGLEDVDIWRETDEMISEVAAIEGGVYSGKLDRDCWIVKNVTGEEGYR